MSELINESGKECALSHLDEAAQSRRCRGSEKPVSRKLNADALLFFLVHRSLKDSKELNKAHGV